MYPRKGFSAVFAEETTLTAPFEIYVISRDCNSIRPATKGTHRSVKTMDSIVSVYIYLSVSFDNSRYIETPLHKSLLPRAFPLLVYPDHSIMTHDIYTAVAAPTRVLPPRYRLPKGAYVPKPASVGMGLPVAGVSFHAPTSIRESVSISDQRMASTSTLLSLDEGLAADAEYRRRIASVLPLDEQADIDTLPSPARKRTLRSGGSNPGASVMPASKKQKKTSPVPRESPPAQASTGIAIVVSAPRASTTPPQTKARPKPRASMLKSGPTHSGDAKGTCRAYTRSPLGQTVVASEPLTPVASPDQSHKRLPTFTLPWRTHEATRIAPLTPPPEAHDKLAATSSPSHEHGTKELLSTTGGDTKVLLGSLQLCTGDTIRSMEASLPSQQESLRRSTRARCTKNMAGA